MRRGEAAALSDSDLRKLCRRIVGLHPQACRVACALNRPAYLLAVRVRALTLTSVHP